MDLKNIHQSKSFHKVILGIAIVVVALVILLVGTKIGEHKARFAGQFGDNFERNFVGPMNRGTRGVFSEKLPGGYGAIGEIVSINLPQIIVAGPNNLEKTVLVGTSTLARRFQENIKISELKVGDSIVVIGNPNDQGQIEAKLIRIAPTRGMGATRLSNDLPK